jgi:hypothetical protein
MNMRQVLRICDRHGLTYARELLAPGSTGLDVLDVHNRAELHPNVVYTRLGAFVRDCWRGGSRATAARVASVREYIAAAGLLNTDPREEVQP